MRTEQLDFVHDLESASSYTADTTWREALADATSLGSPVSPRGRSTRELVNHLTVVGAGYPLVTEPLRKLSYSFAVAEARWIVSGSNKLSELTPYAPRYREFSDDGVYLAGAYGPPFLEQASYVARTLREDPDSRQAVMTIWRPRPSTSKDVPCTVSLQFLRRNDRLHALVNMRSSDLWLGWPYDTFSCAMMTLHVLALIGDEKLSLGAIIRTSGSSHLYSIDDERVGAILAAEPPLRGSYPPLALTLAMLELGDHPVEHVLTETLAEMSWPLGTKHERLAGISPFLAWMVERHRERIAAPSPVKGEYLAERD